MLFPARLSPESSPVLSVQPTVEHQHKRQLQWPLALGLEETGSKATRLFSQRSHGVCQLMRPHHQLEFPAVFTISGHVLLAADALLQDIRE